MIVCERLTVDESYRLDEHVIVANHRRQFQGEQQPQQQQQVELPPPARQLQNVLDQQQQQQPNGQNDQMPAPASALGQQHVEQDHELDVATPQHGPETELQTSLDQQIREMTAKLIADLKLSDHDLELIKSRCPGVGDGGVIESTGRSRYDVPLDPNSLEAQELKSSLLMLLEAKVKHRTPQANIDTLLANMIFMPIIPQQYRNLLPSSFSSLMSALHRCGVPREQYVAYRICICGFVYRCQYANHQRCPVPGCGRLRSMSRKMQYRSIRHWFGLIFSNPYTAHLMAMWPDLQSTDGVLRDVFDGAAFPSPPRGCSHNRCL